MQGRAGAAVPAGRGEDEDSLQRDNCGTIPKVCVSPRGGEGRRARLPLEGREGRGREGAPLCPWFRALLPAPLHVKSIILTALDPCSLM